MLSTFCCVLDIYFLTFLRSPRAFLRPLVLAKIVIPVTACEGRDGSQISFREMYFFLQYLPAVGGQPPPLFFSSLVPPFELHDFMRTAELVLPVSFSVVQLFALICFSRVVVYQLPRQPTLSSENP